MRVATVDIGTNTVLLLVAEQDPRGVARPVVERATITRLGQGVDRTRRLDPEAAARTIACLEAYGREVRSLGAERVAVVGTSAMRDADGGEVVREAVRAHLGVDARVISGQEEARLTFRGALSGLPVGASGEQAVFDIGGGSTEVVLGRWSETSPEILWAESFDVGSVRLTERHGEDVPALRTAADIAFRQVPSLPTSQTPVGIAGTMTTLAAVSMALDPYDAARVHGARMSRAALEMLVERLARTPLDTRRSLAGMEPKRADVIVAGGVLAIALLERWRADSVVISDRGVRWGLAEELLRAKA